MTAGQSNSRPDEHLALFTILRRFDFGMCGAYRADNGSYLFLFAFCWTNAFEAPICLAAATQEPWH